MEWFYFDNMIPIHAGKLSIGNQFLFIMSLIKSFSLLQFEIIMGSRKYGVSVVTLKCICCEKNVTFQPHDFVEGKSILINSFMQG